MGTMVLMGDQGNGERMAKSKKTTEGELDWHHKNRTMNARREVRN